MTHTHIFPLRVLPTEMNVLLTPTKWRPAINLPNFLQLNNSTIQPCRVCDEPAKKE